ncbi:MAG: helicase-exonuclease AddAB subunit AddA, partial [Lachnospiraceae bacterium]|nr:helicase-exonuclease AddAB subunit AddA [Lachnospiraceae bacterium]
MGVTWTKEQQKVIDLRNRNILVSAAAGSGKTAVLVERILTMITEGDHPLDIDQLLIVTFTRAAAAEMKERIRSAVEERLEKEPDNEHLQRQSTLIHNAQINTIDGFCSYVIRNYFHMIDLDPGFRTAEDGELRLMKQDVMKKVIEDAYEAGTEEFYACVECYASGKDDDNIGQQVMKLYEYSMSYPWPKEWLSDCKKYYELKSVDDLMKTKWMRFLMEESKKIFQDAKDMALELLQLCRGDDGPYMYEAALESDLGMIEKLLATEDYDTLVDVLASIKYARLSSKKDENVSERVRMQVQAGRAEVKDMLNHLRDSYFYMSLEEILESIQACKKPVCALIDLTLTFTEAFAARKREKNLVDFADMEHFALDVLVKKQDDKLVYTQAAKEFSERFAEIFIDEYQDSNLVQETILTAVSKIPEGGHNIFMVGDVKQSIYRFRLARPELFMEKFHSYSTEDSLTQRIDLHKNFRSRAQVLSGVNYIFRQIMGKELGGVEYDDEAALYPGAQFPKESQENEHETELLLIESDGEGLEEERGAQTDKEVEALAVAGRIAELIEHEMVYDKKEKGYRKARYSDIVILLRTMTGWTETFGQVLASQGIPSYSASKTGYFSALEVVTVLNYLHILDNPRQDIPLGSILHSPIGGCSSEEMAKIRICNKDGSLYESLQIYLQQGSDNELRRKLQKFWEQYQKLRDCVPYTPIHELILLLLKETGYQLFVSAMPAGEQREANLRMLVEKAMEFEQTSYRGLFNFIR